MDAQTAYNLFVMFLAVVSAGAVILGIRSGNL